MEGGEIELRPVDPAGWDVSDSGDEDAFAKSAESFHAARVGMRMTGQSMKVEDKKAAMQKFWSWGKQGFNKDEKARKELEKQQFIGTYSSVVDLAKREHYSLEVEDREFYLQNIYEATTNEEYDIAAWIKSFSWELTIAKDLKSYERAALSFHFVFLLRRIALVAAFYLLGDYPCLQIFVFLYTSMASLIFVGWVRPYKNENTNRLEMFNEETIFFCSFICLLMEATRGILGPDFRFKLGWVFIGAISVNMFVNLVAIICQIVDDWKYSPVVLKRRARFARFKKMVTEWDEEKCECKCPSCSGNFKSVKINRSPVNFEIKLVTCKIDTTLLDADKT